MRLLRFNKKSEATSAARIGVLLNDNLVGDLTAGYADHLFRAGDTQGAQTAKAQIPNTLAQLFSLGDPAWAIVRSTLEHLRAQAGRTDLDLQTREALFTPFDQCRLHAPIRPSKMIAVGRNYMDHLGEAGLKLPHAVPSAWIKANSTITGPNRDIIKPACVQQLDYETELAMVIGRKCKNVPEAKANDVIFGYMVVNDISARDIVRIERKEGNQLLGKMFDTFAPMGPWIVSADEIEDPMNLRILTRVNGEQRQNGNTGQMIWSIPKLISYLSQMTLEAGDVILTGTPAGVAHGRKADQPSWMLQNGDVLESEVEGIGVLRNTVVDAQEEVSWQW